jgi:predicted metal-dependent peptidase
VSGGVSGGPCVGLDLDRLAAAKLWLTSEQADLPYLSSALYSLHAASSTEIETMTADTDWRLYVNPAWVAQASVPEIGAQLAHLAWHLLRDHALRAGSMLVGSTTAQAWRDATDVTVAETLDASGLREHRLGMPAERGLPAGRSAEEHYATLSRLPPPPPEGHDGAHQQAGGAASEPGHDDSCGSATDGLVRGYELPASADIGSVGTVQADEIRRQVAIEFREHVTSRGTAPGDSLRWASAILEPVVPWQQVLAAAVRRAAGWANGQTDYTYTRPSRRQSAVRGVILPATRRPLPTVAVVVDTSGSVDDGMLGQALGEVDGAIAALGVPGAQMTVLACDAAVASVVKVGRAADARLGGGGGTDMRVGIDAASTLRPRPDVLVVLTDGYTPWPEHPPAGMGLVAALLHRSGTSAPPSPAWAVTVDCAMS